MRLHGELPFRVEALADRMLDVAEELARRGVFRRVVDQVAGCGTSVGANVFEADEAMSAADFCKCLSIALKELNECRFWVRLIGRRNWISVQRLEPLTAEMVELQKIIRTMILNTRRGPRD